MSSNPLAPPGPAATKRDIALCGHSDRGMVTIGIADRVNHHIAHIVCLRAAGVAQILQAAPAPETLREGEA